MGAANQRDEQLEPPEPVAWGARSVARLGLQILLAPFCMFSH